MDFAKEGLFNILQHQFPIEGSRCLELFAGSGNVGWELLSRGAEHLVFVEQQGLCVEAMKQTAQLFGVEPQVNILRGEVRQSLSRWTLGQFDLVFADPPYDLDFLQDLPDLLLPLLLPEGLLIVEHDNKHRFDTHPRFVQQRNYGRALFSFFE
jgi:16S rRNA (guanine(966)-N(2))-methyltransferase RsmD